MSLLGKSNGKLLKRNGKLCRGCCDSQELCSFPFPSCIAIPDKTFGAETYQIGGAQTAWRVSYALNSVSGSADDEIFDNPFDTGSFYRQTSASVQLIHPTTWSGVLAYTFVGYGDAPPFVPVLCNLDNPPFVLQYAFFQEQNGTVFWDGVSRQFSYPGSVVSVARNGITRGSGYAWVDGTGPDGQPIAWFSGPAAGAELLRQAARSLVGMSGTVVPDIVEGTTDRGSSSGSTLQQLRSAAYGSARRSVGPYLNVVGSNSASYNRTYIGLDDNDSPVFTESGQLLQYALVGPGSNQVVRTAPSFDPDADNDGGTFSTQADAAIARAGSTFTVSGSESGSSSRINFYDFSGTSGSYLSQTSSWSFQFSRSMTIEPVGVCSVG